MANASFCGTCGDMYSDGGFDMFGYPSSSPCSCHQPELDADKNVWRVAHNIERTIFRMLEGETQPLEDETHMIIEASEFVDANRHDYIMFAVCVERDNTIGRMNAGYEVGDGSTIRIRYYGDMSWEADVIEGEVTSASELHWVHDWWFGDDNS